jgi:hypothetical protein
MSGRFGGLSAGWWILVAVLILLVIVQIFTRALVPR